MSGEGMTDVELLTAVLREADLRLKSATDELARLGLRERAARKARDQAAAELRAAYRRAAFAAEDSP